MRKRPRKRPKEEATLSPVHPEKVEARGSWTKESLEEYAKYKSHTEAYCDWIVEQYLADGKKNGISLTIDKLVKRLRDCGSYIHVAHFYLQNVRRVIQSFSCKKHLHCGGCAMRRAALYSVVFFRCMQHLLTLEENSHLVPCLITFTIKNRPDLLDAFTHLEKSLQTLKANRRNAVYRPHKYSNLTVFRYVQGGFGSYEIKRGSGSGEWHVHLHMVVLLDARDFVFTEEIVPVRKEKDSDIQMYRRIYKPLSFQKSLRDEWYKITGDSHQVDVRALYPREKFTNLQAADIPEEQQAFVFPDTEVDSALIAGSSEAIKYALSSVTISFADRYYAADILKGRNLIQRFGIFRGLALPESEADMIEAELRNQPYMVEVYQYLRKKGGGLYEFTELHEDGPRFMSISAKKNSEKSVSRKKFIRFTQDDVAASVKQMYLKNNPVPF